MSLIITAALIWAICKLISMARSKAAQRKEEEASRRYAEYLERRERDRQAAIEQARQNARIAAMEKEQERQRKEQERQASQLAKHEDMIRKLEMRMATAESELAFNREQRERLFKLLDIEERERDAAIEGSATWQKHHKQVISLEKQIHAVQKRIDKANMDKAYCESKLSA